MCQFDYAAYGIVDPMEVRWKDVPEEQNPPYDPVEHAQVFTDLARAWRSGEIPDVTDERIQEIKKAFFEAHPDVPPELLANTWGPTEERLMKNPGAAAFYERFAMEGEYFPHWALNVPTARAIPGAFGYGWNFQREFGVVPIDDNHLWWGERQPILAYLRKRAKNIVAMIEKQHRELMEQGKKQTIGVLGAGYLPEFWALGYKLDPETQKLIVCDRDFSLDPDEIKSYLGPVEVDYRLGDMKEVMLADESLVGQIDFMSMPGLMVYVPHDKRQLIVKPVMSLLSPGGQFMFDQQVGHPGMDFANEIFNWCYVLPMYLNEDLEDMEDDVGEFCADCFDDIASIGTYEITDEEGLIGATILIEKIQ